MTKEDIYHILITPDNLFIQHAGVMLTSLFENNRNLKFCIHLVAGRDTDFLPLYKIIVDYENEYKSYVLDLDQLKDFKVSHHVSVATYFRIMMGRILPEDLQQILYLDCDIIILKDITSLLQTGLREKIIAAVPELLINPAKKRILDIPEDQDYFNAGVLLVNLNAWRQNDITNKLFEYIIRHPEKLEFWDQDALNATLKSDWVPLDETYNFTTPYCIKYPKKYPAVVHYTGKSKPWHFMDRHPFKKAYKKYLFQTIWKNYSPDDFSYGNIFRKYNLVPAFVEKMLFKK